MLSITIFLLVTFNHALTSEIVTHPEWSKHHTNEELYGILENVNKKCPEITHLYNLSSPYGDKTVFGYSLNVIAIGKTPDRHVAGIPEFKYIGNMHGNEVVGRELLLRMISEICEKYLENDPFTRKLVSETRIHILPTMNPDGWSKADGKQKHFLLGRTNGNNVDLNRNFPDLDRIAFHHTKNGGPLDHLLSYATINPSQLEAETLMVMDWIDQVPFVLAANLHGGAVVANYPYDNSDDGRTEVESTPDDELFMDLARDYSSENSRMFSKGKKCSDVKSFDDGITNGAEWYPLKGGMQDYNYLASNCFEITVEMSCDKYPEGERLPQFWKWNKKSLYNFILQVHRGIKGMVYELTNYGLEPLSDVPIQIFNATNDEFKPILHNVNSNPDGDYYRMLTEGTFIAVIQPNGYEPAITCFTIGSIPDIDNGDFSPAMQRVFVLRKLKDTDEEPTVEIDSKLQKTLKLPKETIVSSWQTMEQSCQELYRRSKQSMLH